MSLVSQNILQYVFYISGKNFCHIVIDVHIFHCVIQKVGLFNGLVHYLTFKVPVPMIAVLVVDGEQGLYWDC